MRNSDKREVIGFIAFAVLLLALTKFGVYFRDYEYTLLITVMIAGFIAGGGR